MQGMASIWNSGDGKLWRRGPGQHQKQQSSGLQEHLFWAAFDGMPTYRSRISLPARKVYQPGLLLLDQVQLQLQLQRNAGPRHRQTAWVSAHTDPTKQVVISLA